MPDMRRVIYNIMRNFGHDVFLQRRLPDSRTGQYSDPNFTTKLERHTVRDMIPSSTQLAGTADEQEEGVVTTVDVVFWFLWDVAPKQGDRIYEEDPRYVQRQSTWLLDYAHPMRGNRGRIEYWSCGATRETPT